MRAREFITEQRELPPEVADPMRYTYVIPGLSASDPYNNYRFGVAMARARSDAGSDDHTIDPYKPESWPTPWDMINKGEFCRSAIALGQAYTLWMCSPQLNTELWLVNNFSEKDVHLVVVIDKKTVLNYTLGQVMPIEECDFEVLNKTTKKDLTHIKI